AAAATVNYSATFTCNLISTRLPLHPRLIGMAQKRSGVEQGETELRHRKTIDPMTSPEPTPDRAALPTNKRGLDKDEAFPSCCSARFAKWRTTAVAGPTLTSQLITTNRPVADWRSQRSRSWFEA